MPVVVNLHEAKSNLSRLAKRAAAGEQIIIASRGRPVAMLTRPPKNSKKIPWGVFKGKIEMADDFDAPLEMFKGYM